MASKNWQWVVEVWCEFDNIHEKGEWANRYEDYNVRHLFEWAPLTERQYLTLGGLLPEFKTRRRQRNRKSLRSRPKPPETDWSYGNKDMTPRLIHDCLPIIIKAQKQEGQTLGPLMRPYNEHTMHWRLRNIHTKEVIPGNLLTE